MPPIMIVAVCCALSAVCALGYLAGRIHEKLIASRDAHRFDRAFSAGLVNSIRSERP